MDFEQLPQDFHQLPPALKRKVSFFPALEFAGDRTTCLIPPDISGLCPSVVLSLSPFFLLSLSHLASLFLCLDLFFDPRLSAGRLVN